MDANITFLHSRKMNWFKSVLQEWTIIFWKNVEMQSIFQSLWTELLIQAILNKLHWSCYLQIHDDTFSIDGRFLELVDCCNKTGVEIASIIINILQKMAYPFLIVIEKGMEMQQTHIRSPNPLSLYSPCVAIPSIFVVQIQQNRAHRL